MEEQVWEWEDTGISNSTGPVYRCGHCKKFYNPDSAAVLMGRQLEKPPFCQMCGKPMRNGKEKECHDNEDSTKKTVNGGVPNRTRYSKLQLHPWLLEG